MFGDSVISFSRQIIGPEFAALNCRVSKKDRLPERRISHHS